MESGYATGGANRTVGASAADRLAGGDAQAQREKEVHSGFRRLLAAVEMVEAAQGTLHERVAPVLSMEPPQPVNEKLTKGLGATSKVAAELHAIAERLEGIAAREAAVARRVEV